MSTEQKQQTGNVEWHLIVRAAQPQASLVDLKALIQDSSKDGLCWEHCRQIAAVHGVSSLVHRRLSPLFGNRPPTVWDRWTADCADEGIQNLARLVELRQIGGAFSEHQIPLLAIKGPVLGTNIYGDVALRPFGDLDLIVPPECRDRAVECLVDMGFVPQFRLNSTDRQRFYNRYPELHLTHGTTGTLVDLHWELVSRKYQFASILDGYWERTVDIRFGSTVIKTLGPTDTILFLLLHAAKHEWRCLGWITDLAWLAHRHSQIDWRRIESAAAESGVSRIVTVGRQLIQRLFPEALPPGQTELPDDPLVQEILEGFSDEIKKVEICRQWPWRRIYFRALDRRVDRLRYLYDILFAPTPLDWNRFPLPESLSWLYPFIRAGRLVAKHRFGSSSPSDIGPSLKLNDSSETVQV